MIQSEICEKPQKWAEKLIFSYLLTTFQSLHPVFRAHLLSCSFVVFKGNRYCDKCSQVAFQTYVESLKNSGSFGKEKQALAFDKAKAIITSELTEELKVFITQNYGDLQTWIANQTEASIHKLKK